MSRIEDSYSPGVVSDARRLPDSDFHDHPDVAPLKAQIDELEAKHRQASADLEVHKRTVETVKVRLAELIEMETEARAGLRDLAAADLAAADLDFTASANGRERCQRLALQIKGGQDALALLEGQTAALSSPVRFAADRQVDIDVRMRDLIWPLKLQAAYRARG